MSNLPAIRERFEALAADALEGLIEDVEKKNPVKVTGLEVELIDEKASNAASPTVEVSLTVAEVKPSARSR